MPHTQRGLQNISWKALIEPIVPYLSPMECVLMGLGNHRSRWPCQPRKHLQLCLFFFNKMNALYFYIADIIILRVSRGRERSYSSVKKA